MCVSKRQKNLLFFVRIIFILILFIFNYIIITVVITLNTFYFQNAIDLELQYQVDYQHH